MKPLYPIVLLIALIGGCDQKPDAHSQESESETKKVLDHHWEAFKANDLEETMKDYTDESVLITPNATHRGADEIRANFIRVFKMFPKDSTEFNLQTSQVVKDVGYILWNSKTPTFTLSYGTDTFIIRNGKIVRQTFAGVFE